MMRSQARPAAAGWAAVLLGVVVIAWFAGVMFHSGNGSLVGDYGEWTYHGVLLRDVLEHHPDRLYTLKDYPVPNSLTTIGLGLLMLVLPWMVASKLWLLLGAALGLWTSAELQRAAGRVEPAKMLLIPAAVLFGSAFWFGFINFLLGTYLAMLLCAWLLRGRQSRWLYAALLVLIFFSHMIPFGFAMLVFGLYVLQTRRWRLLVQMLPSLALCVWYFVGRRLHGDIDGQAGMGATVPWGTGAFVAFKVNTLLKSWGFINPATTDTNSVLLRYAGLTGFLALFAANAFVAVVMIGGMIERMRAVLRDRAVDRFFWMAVMIFGAVALVLPGAAAGISDPGGRMLQTALWCALCVVPLGARRWLPGVVVGCALLLVVADGGLFAAVGVRPAVTDGVAGGPLPARLRGFAHVYYGSRAYDYDDIAQHRMDQQIWPTAMFVRQAESRQK